MAGTDRNGGRSSGGGGGGGGGGVWRASSGGSKGSKGDDEWELERRARIEKVRRLDVPCRAASQHRYSLISSRVLKFMWQG